MKIEHIAIWVTELEGMKDSYTRYFNFYCSPKYLNQKNGFSSYFLPFPEGARIELKHKTGLSEKRDASEFDCGLAHFSISVGSEEKVIQLNEQLKIIGFTIKGETRTTGDGYYESVVLDPEGNQIEVTARY